MLTAFHLEIGPVDPLCKWLAGRESCYVFITGWLLIQTPHKEPTDVFYSLINQT